MRRFAVALALMVSAPSVSVAQPTSRFAHYVAYRAEGDCGSREGFEAKLAARLPEWRLARAGEPVPRLGVVARRIAGGAEGSITIAQPTGERATRTLTAANCSELVDGLALIAALSALAAESSQSREARADEAGEGRAGGDAGANAVAVEQSAHGADASQDFGEPSSGGLIAGETVGVERGSEFVLGLAGVAQRGMAPGWLPGVSAFVLWGYRTGTSFAPEAAVGAYRADGATGMAGSAKLGTGATIGYLRACPLAMPSASRLRVGVCAVLELGELAMEARNVESGRVRRRSYVAVGGRAQLRWEATRSLRVVVGGELLAPLRRDAFGYDGVVWHEVPLVTEVLSLGLEARAF